MKYQGNKKDVKCPIDTPRYLLVILPDPEGVESDKEDQMRLIEELIKEMNFLENSNLKNFKICLMKDYEQSIQKLIN